MRYKRLPPDLNMQPNHQSPNLDREEQKACALAALAQSAVLVHRCANAQACHPNFTRALMDGFMLTDAESADDVYGPVENLLLGINSAEAMLNHSDTSLIQPLKYVVELMTLESTLQRRPDAIETLGNMIHDLSSSYATLGEVQQCEHFAEIYKKTAGSLGRKIHVVGIQQQLEQRDVANKVRALLLCGIRFAWLWRQLGGRRWHLLIYRSKIGKTLKQLHQMRTIH